MNLRETTRDILSQAIQPTNLLVESVEFLRGSVTTEVHARDVKCMPHKLPHEYSTLAVVSIMYGAFQQLAANTDLGFDLAREYQAAVAMYR